MGSMLDRAFSGTDPMFFISFVKENTQVRNAGYGVTESL